MQQKMTNHVLLKTQFVISLLIID